MSKFTIAAVALLGLPAVLATNCTFTGTDGYLEVNQTKNSCSTIILDSLQVPGGVTLNLENLNDGTTVGCPPPLFGFSTYGQLILDFPDQVIFEGRTTWDYAEWSGSLFSVSGNNITVRGAPGSVLDGQGALWWDGEGNGGGVTKPKFFKANNLNDSVLDSIYILNAPINSFSINYINNLLVKDIVVNNTAGDELGSDGNTVGHNTDAFDVNNCDGVLITGARVWNQDDCVAVNSGQNVRFQDGYCSGGHGISIGSVGGRTNNYVNNITFENVVMEKSQQSVRIVSSSIQPT